MFFTSKYPIKEIKLLHNPHICSAPKTALNKQIKCSGSSRLYDSLGRFGCASYTSSQNEVEGTGTGGLLRVRCLCSCHHQGYTPALTTRVGPWPLCVCVCAWVRAYMCVFPLLTSHCIIERAHNVLNVHRRK